MGMDMGMDMWNMLAAILSSHAVAHTPHACHHVPNLAMDLGNLRMFW